MDSDQIFALAGLLFFCCNGDSPATALRGLLLGGGGENNDMPDSGFQQ